MKKTFYFITASLLLLMLSGCKKNIERQSESYNNSSNYSLHTDASSETYDSIGDNIVSNNSDFPKENKSAEKASDNKYENSQITTVDIPEVGKVEVTIGEDKKPQDNSEGTGKTDNEDSGNNNKTDNSDEKNDPSKSDSSSDGWTKGYY